jgi:hemoglobin
LTNQQPVNFPKPPPAPRPDPAIYQALGTEGVIKLLRAFYHQLSQSPVNHLFPQDPTALMAAADNSALFWVTMLGGPSLYADQHGPPMMRQRHHRFAITGAARQTWLNCWDQVLATASETLDFPAQYITGFKAWIRTFSAWIVNTAD